MTESHQREKERLENELGLLEKQHKEQVLIIEGSTKQLRSEFYDEKAKLSSTIESQKYTFETRLTALRIDTENDKQRVTAEHQATKDEMIRRFEEEKTLMRKDLQRLNDQFRKELYKKNREVEEAKKKQEVEEKRLEEQNAAEKLRLEIKKEKEYRKLKDDVEALKGAMVKGDHFKAISDRDLIARFKDIASEIDDFSRVRWDNRRKATWPFPDSVLRKSENERRSKQYVIQNTIWAILYERIFCTPFRVLGPQGKLMEQDWIENYGQGELSCMHPINLPHQITEWRYETIKACLDAINRPLLDSSEPDYNLKQSYEQCLNDATEDVSHELGRVASMDHNDKQRIGDLVRKAAKLWLEIGQQRYRIFLLMSQSGAKPSRSGQASVNRDGAQELVANPELRRMGNVQGERLERDELVTDCKGKFSFMLVH
ncbi:hypothetical protein V8E54_009668 [Elaphomyces granulatus]